MNHRLLIGLSLLVALLLAACGQTAPTLPPGATPALSPQVVAPVIGGEGAAATAAPVVLPTTAVSASPLQSPLQTPVQALGGSLTVMTHDSFSASEEVVAKFKAQCGCEVTFLKSGDTGLALNKAILSKGNPLADVFYGVDNTFLSRALAADIFEPYASPALAGIPDEFKLDSSNRLLPVDFGYVVLNYDKVYFQKNNLAVPTSLRDLTKPEYKGLLVVENPATSSPGLAFLLSTVAAFGEGGEYDYLRFWRDLRANDVSVVDGWESAYYTDFSGSSGKGPRPLVVSYATSPAAEVFYADPKPADAPTGNIAPAGQTVRQVEFVGILKGAKNPALARMWVDFMLGETFQGDIPLQMWVYPARSGVALPDVFTQYAQLPEQPASLTPEQIEAGREKWLNDWTDAVLR